MFSSAPTRLFPRFLSRLSPGVVGVSTLALLFAGTAAYGQATYDVQVPYDTSSLTTALEAPAGVAVAPDGTVYVADVTTTHEGGRTHTTGRVVRITPTGYVGGTAGGTGNLATSSVTPLTITGVTLTNPNAVAVDSLGNLYITDYGANAVYKLAAPETSGAATKFTYAGTGPTAIATDSGNNVYIADSNGDIYEYASGTTTGATTLAIGSTRYKPTGLAVNAAGDVFFASAAQNALYEYVPGSGGANVYETGATFEFGDATTGLPIGMGFDPAGNLYVLDSYAAKLWQIEPTNPTTNTFQVPFSTATTTPGSLTVSNIGNLYISDDSATKSVAEMFYNGNPVNYGTVLAGTNSPRLNVNYNVYTADNPIVQYMTVQGDYTQELSFPTYTGTCNGDVGVCHLQLEANYQGSTPGLRNAVIGFTDQNNNVFAVHVVGTSGAASVALYPGTQSSLPATQQTTCNAQTLNSPQGAAVTGDGKTFFIADEGQIVSGSSLLSACPAVYAYTAANGVPTSARTTVVAGVGTSFPSPDAVALDAYGNLYIADYSGTVTRIAPAYSRTTGATTWPGTGPNAITQLSFPTGVGPTHPVSLVVDLNNNLYIGDAGSGGVNADASNPGYVIKVPADGAPATRLSTTIGGTPMIYPATLTTDSFGNLFILDAGDGYTTFGSLDVLPVSTGQLTAVGTGNFTLNTPSGIAMDSANDLYLLDSYNERILEIPFTYSGSVPTANTSGITLLGGASANSGLGYVYTGSSLVVWPSQNTLSVLDLGYLANTSSTYPVQALTLTGQNVTASIASVGGSTSFTGINVGNEPITFTKPTISTGFSLSDCGTTGDKLAVGLPSACTATVGYTGTALGATGTITLNASAAADGSALGNVITVNGPPVGSTPIAQLTPTSATSTSATGTAVLENIGGGTLTVSGIIPSGGTLGAGANACATGTNLTNGQSCNIYYAVTAPNACYVFIGSCTATSTEGITVTSNANTVTGNYTYNVVYDCFIICVPSNDLAVRGGTAPAATPGSSFSDLSVGGPISSSSSGGTASANRSGFGF